MQYWQIIRTDRRGRITGDTFSNIGEAINNFIIDSQDLLKRPKDGVYVEVLFKELDSQVVTFASDRINYIYLKIVTYPSGGEEVFIEFSAERTLEEVKANMEAFKVPEGYEGRYYSKVYAINYKTGEQIAEVINPLPKTEEESDTNKTEGDGQDEGVQNSEGCSKRKS